MVVLNCIIRTADTYEMFSWALGGLASGAYYWAVQAGDARFTGSPWALEETITVP